jgi:hypothetical protein
MATARKIISAATFYGTGHRNAPTIDDLIDMEAKYLMNAVEHTTDRRILERSARTIAALRAQERNWRKTKAVNGSVKDSVFVTEDRRRVFSSRALARYHGVGEGQLLTAYIDRAVA